MNGPRRLALCSATEPRSFGRQHIGDSETARSDAGIEAALSVVRWEVEEQLRAVDGLDAKADRAAAFGLAIATGFAGVTAIIASNAGGAAISVMLAVAGLVALALGATALLYCRTYGVSTWRTGPGSDGLARVAATYPATNAQLWLIEEFAVVLATNAPLVREKSKWAGRLVVAVAVEASVAAGGLAVIAITELSR